MRESRRLPGTAEAASSMPLLGLVLQLKPIFELRDLHTEENYLRPCTRRFGMLHPILQGWPVDFPEPDQVVDESHTVAYFLAAGRP